MGNAEPDLGHGIDPLGRRLEFLQARRMRIEIVVGGRLGGLTGLPVDARLEIGKSG